MRTLAIYAGSFDPPTLGHLDVIERATRLFDKLIVAVGANSAKSPLFSTEERLQALRAATAHLKTVEVDAFSGMLIHYAEERGAKSLVRGLRATADFEYEFQMAMVNRRLAGEIETVFLMTTWEYSYLSSSMVREVAQLGGDYAQLVPPTVANLIAEALKRRAESSKL
jgi:pantetheine-phosphate adenylyltransferase